MVFERTFSNTPANCSQHHNPTRLRHKQFRNSSENMGALISHIMGKFKKDARVVVSVQFVFGVC